MAKQLYYIKTSKSICQSYQVCKWLFCMTKPCKFVNTFCLLERKRKILKDEKKHHGAVDESSSEQQFHKLDAITFVV